MVRRFSYALVAIAQVVAVVALAAAPAQGAETDSPRAEWEQDFTAADLDFFRPTASEDPTGLTRSITAGVLMPQQTACVMLTVQQWNAGERVGQRHLVRHLGMTLDELLELVKRAQDPPRRAGSRGGPPVFGGLFEFYTGFAGFPERSSP